MRISVLAVLALAAAPLPLDAQRFPRGARRPPPAVPAELPPAAPSVDRALAYRRVRLAVETYPHVMVMAAPLPGGESPPTSWTEFGAGTRAEYRVTHWVLASLDLTASAWGGPARSHTAELGVRIMPDRYVSSTRPFADVRVGYIGSYTVGAPVGDGIPGAGSHGLGAVAGAGFHHDLSRSFSLLTTASVMRGQLSPTGPVADAPTYDFTAYRLSVGLRYNRVRQVLTAQPPVR